MIIIRYKGYCVVAGLALGKLIHIEDLNPQNEEGGVQAFDPGSIIVAGVVRVAYKFQE